MHEPENSPRQINLLYWSIFVILLLRALTLGVTDLIDPTESRYASIAAHMVASGNWLVPMIDLPSGLEPYLGKPPLHFWLTAISFKLFGEHEWASRLPSLISAFFVIGAVVRFGRSAWGLKYGLTAGLVAISTPFFFMFSGGSITDVTLTACISWGVVSSYLTLYSNEAGARKRNGCILAVSVALGFMTKGPVAIALTALPIFIFLAIKKDILLLKKTPWLSCTAVFFAITLPWFILSELENPGFLKYFFWNENIARYLIKDYGDKYGSGHVYTRGTAIFMMILATTPWAFILPYKYLRDGWNTTKSALLRDDALIFVLIWGLSSAAFFCLVRQLHAAYLLPSVPGIALALTRSFNGYKLSDRAQNIALITIGLVGLTMIGISYISSSYYHSTPQALIFLVFGILLFWFFVRNSADISSNIAIPFAILSCLGILVFAPYINGYRSAEGILRNIASVTNAKKLKIGITSSNLYSPYWMALAGHEESLKTIKISYVNPYQPVDASLKHLLVRKEDLKPLSKVQNRFKLVCSFGKWRWLTSEQAILKRSLNEICPFDLPSTASLE